MIVFVTIAVIVSTCDLLLGLNILLRKNRGSLHILFFCQALVMLLSILSQVLVQAATDIEQVKFFSKIYNILTVLTLAVALHFYFKLIGGYKEILIILGYVPAAAASMLIFFSSGSFSRIERVGDLWETVYDVRGLPDAAILVTLNAYLCVMVLMLIVWRMKTSSIKEKRQGALLIATGFLLIANMNINDFLLPSLGILRLPLTSTLTSTTAYLIILFYSLTRYRFLSFGIKDRMEDILSNINEVIIAADPAGKINEANAYCLRLLRWRGNGWLDRSLSDIVAEGEGFAADFRRLLEGGIERIDARVRLKAADEHIPVDASLVRMRDKFGDYTGILVIARENLGVRQMKKVFKLSDRQMEVILLSVEGLSNAAIAKRLFIARRTVETHLFSIYSKLDVKNKVGLMRIAGRFGVA
ncbi:MAG: PAS domain-containing protein [Spirochaetales bacterium]|nr:PAS domain-containing protein [Spirochaetales bacterium]